MKKKIIFFAIFSVLGLIALQIPVNFLAGSKVKFTLFDLFAPASGAFVGSVFGIFTVLTAQIVNIFMHGTIVDKGVIIRLFSTLFAIWFFALPTSSFWGAKRLQNQLKTSQDSGQARMTVFNNLLFLVPALAIISFNLNPIGRSVWFYSLFWLVPYLVWPLRERFLIARSLGATMTAHAVGGAIWIWAFSLPASVWISLIPIVIVERMIFAMGISANYILFNNVGAYLTSKKLLPKGVRIDKKYII